MIFGTDASTAGSMGIAADAQTGKVEIFSVAPGHYQLQQGDPPRLGELDATTSQEIDPNLGSPAAVLTGNLKSADGSALPENLDLSLSSVIDPQNHAPLHTTAFRGAFLFRAVLPGLWELWAESPGKALPITAISIGSRTRAGSKLTVRDKPIQLVATVSQSETRVEGFTRNKNGKGQPGVMMVLVPKEAAAFPSLVRRDQSDSDGSFSLRDVAPGQYTVVAIQDGWELDWARQEVIGRYLSHGVAVTVTEGSGKLLKLSEAVPVQSR
jgi:hypothetical protein